MKRAGRDVLYFETGPDNEPTLSMKPGEEFEVETQLNRGPWLNSHPERETPERVLRGGNPSSGAIFVEGAEPGQRLIVHVGEFDLDPVGFTSFAGSNDAMPGWLGGSGVGAHHMVVGGGRLQDGPGGDDPVARRGFPVLTGRRISVPGSGAGGQVYPVR